MRIGKGFLYIVLGVLIGLILSPFIYGYTVEYSGCLPALITSFMGGVLTGLGVLHQRLVKFVKEFEKVTRFMNMLSRVTGLESRSKLPRFENQRLTFLDKSFTNLLITPSVRKSE